MLLKGLKFIPNPPKPNSHRSLIKDFNNFTRNMGLKFLFADRNSKPHPFHVKSNWQPPPQPSAALANYLERRKYEIATISICDTQDNLSAKEREALKKLRANTKVNMKKKLTRETPQSLWILREKSQRAMINFMTQIAKPLYKNQ